MYNASRISETLLSVSILLSYPRISLLPYRHHMTHILLQTRLLGYSQQYEYVCLLCGGTLYCILLVRVHTVQVLYKPLPSFIYLTLIID